MPASEASPVPLHDAPVRPRADRWLVQALFFAGVWAYAWFVVKPRLIYDAFGIYLPYPEFAMDGACFRAAWSRAAGPLEYVSGFLSQWFSVSPVGALIVTAVAGLISLGTNRLIRDMGETRGWFPSLLPAFAMLILYRTYHHPLTALLALAICLWLVAAYQAMAAPNVGIRIPAAVRHVGRPVVFLAMCLGLYCLVGTVCVLFGMLVGAWYVCTKRRVMAGAGAMAACALVPWLAGAQLFHLTVVEAYSVAWPFGVGSASDMETWPLNVLRGLFLLPPAMLLVAVLLRWHVSTSRGAAAAGCCDAPERPSCVVARRGRRTLRVAAELAVLAGAFVAVHLLARSPHRETRFEMVHFTREREWDEVLCVARQLPRSGSDCFSRHLVDRALYHTGRLGDEMFSFSQDQAGLLLLDEDVPDGPPKFWMLSEIAWELGDVNLAEQRAFERLDAVGECPSAIELLALVCLAKNQPGTRSAESGKPADRPAAADHPAGASSAAGREAARVLLSRMTKDVIHGRRARALLELLDGDPPQGDPWLEQIERVRALRSSDDRVFQTYSEELMLEGLLQANPRNQMAFEYLMAFYLLSRRADKVVENLHRLDDLGYREIPRHYEEAILIHANQSPRRVALHGRKIRPETVQRFHHFVDRLRPWQNQPDLAVGALAEEFGDGYFYYYAFGVSGRGGSPQGQNSQGPLAGVSGHGVSGTGRAR